MVGLKVMLLFYTYLYIKRNPGSGGGSKNLVVYVLMYFLVLRLETGTMESESKFPLESQNIV